MKGLKLTILITAIILLTAIPAYPQAGNRDIGLGSFVPAPRLLQPRNDVVDLEGKPYMTFRWSPHETLSLGSNIYDFRLYRGTDMLESTLIYKEEIPGPTHEHEVSADLFEDGRIYTWSLRQKYRSAGKSRRSVQLFKVTR